MPSPRRWRAVHLLEELDAPGEWCYDRPSGKIVFIPPEGFSADSVIALGTASDHVLRIEGDGNRVEGLRFCAKIGLPALCVDGGRSNVVEGCTFVNPRGYLWYVMNGDNLVFRNNRVVNDGTVRDPLPYAGRLLVTGGTNIDFPAELTDRR